MNKKSIVKASLFTLILAFFAIGTIAFAKEVMKNENSAEVNNAVIKKVTTEWFYFTSPISPTHPNYAAALQDPNNYSPTNSTIAPEDCEPGNEKVCAVRAEPNPADNDQPNPTDLAALSSEMASTNPDPDLVILKYFEEQ